MTASVSVLLPTFQAARYIDGCLDALAAQDFPAAQLDVVVVDGCSPDGTALRAAEALRRTGLRGRVLSNPVAEISSNLNRALAATSSDYIVRVDAKSRLAPDHVSKCVGLLAARPELSVVGAHVLPVAADDSPEARAVARVHLNRWVMGGAGHRDPAASGPAPTVYLGAFRRHDLVAVGGWDERLLVNEDFDLNRRLGARGTVWLADGLGVEWIAPDALRDLVPRYYAYGRGKARFWVTTGDRPLGRQFVLLSAPLVGVVGGFATLSAAWRRRKLGRVVAGGAGAVGLGLAAIDRLGTRQRPASLGESVLASFAAVLVGGAWWAGAAVELVSEVRPLRRAPLPDHRPGRVA